MRLKAAASLLMVLCLFLFSTGCMDLPEYEDEQAGLPGTQVSTPKPGSPTPTIYVTNQTPYPTPTQEPLVSTIWNLSLVPYSPESQYAEIYNESLDMEYNVVAFSYNLSQPPMVIKYHILPINISYERYSTSPVGSREWESASVDTYDPDGWAEIKVFDKDTGELVKSGGYKKEYLDNLKGDINIYSPGDYQIEIRGNRITIDVAILVGGLNPVGT